MISICIPTYNRTNLLYESFAKVLDDPRVSEIVIVDDHSDVYTHQAIFEHTSHLKMTRTTCKKSWNKIKLYRNEKNLDCYRNKREAVSKATNEWVILLDSDNVITTDYINMLFQGDWFEDRIYQPSFARPHFDFGEWSGQTITKHNVAYQMADPTFQTMLNACNYFVNRDEYLRVWDGSVDPVTSDSIYMAYRWLAARNSIYVVPGMEYEHRVHEGSHYRNNVRRTPKGFHEDIVQRLKNMK